MPTFNSRTFLVDFTVIYFSRLSGYKMKKRVGAIEEFVIQPISEGRSLHCVLAVSGWIEDVNL